MHYLVMISDRPDMVFQTELMMRTVNKFAGNRPVAFSVVVNGNSMEPVRPPLRLTRRTFHNRYISTNADVYDCPYHWSLHAPCRWFVPPKMETCVFIDTDIIACRDLSDLHALDRDTAHGVPALKNPLSDEQWNGIGMTVEDRNYYFNFGMVVVPSRHMGEIGRMMLDKVPKFMVRFRDVSYYAGQIALAHSLKESGVRRAALPRRFNWLDSLPPPVPDDLLLMHYTINRPRVTRASACGIRGDVYADLISDAAKHFYGHKTLA